MIATCRAGVHAAKTRRVPVRARCCHAEIITDDLSCRSKGRPLVDVEFAPLAPGMTLLVIGYRRNRRGWRATTAIVLILAGAIGPFAHGFSGGLQGGWTDVRH